jgi:hypothetical protein
VPAQDDVRRIALALPGALAAEGEFAFRTNGRLFAWAWLERIDPKRARVASRDVIVVRVASEMDKFALVDADPDTFFTEPHFDGYAAVMIRLARVDPAMLERLITDSHELAAARRPRRSRVRRG